VDLVLIESADPDVRREGASGADVHTPQPAPPRFNINDTLLEYLPIRLRNGKLLPSLQNPLRTGKQWLPGKKKQKKCGKGL